MIILYLCSVLWTHKVSTQLMQTHIHLCDVHLLCLTGQTMMYMSPLATINTAALSSSTSLWEPLLLLCDNGSPLILVKAVSLDEFYENTIVLTVLKIELTTTAYAPFHVWTWWTRCKYVSLLLVFGKHITSAYNVASGLGCLFLFSGIYFLGPKKRSWQDSSGFLFFSCVFRRIFS
jgi:hypothetical protein